MCRSANAGSSNPSKASHSGRKRKAGVKQVDESEESEAEVKELWLLEEVGDVNIICQLPIKVPVCVDGVNVCVELDILAPLCR